MVDPESPHSYLLGGALEVRRSSGAHKLMGTQMHKVTVWSGTGGSLPRVHPGPARVAVRPGEGQTTPGLHHVSLLLQGIFGCCTLCLPLGSGGSHQCDHL